MEIENLIRIHKYHIREIKNKIETNLRVNKVFENHIRIHKQHIKRLKKQLKKEQEIIKKEKLDVIENFKNEKEIILTEY